MAKNVESTAFLDMTRERWSVRRFAPEQISDEHMSRILEAGRNAPSACNYQPQRILVLQSDQAIATVRSVTHWAFNAPTSCSYARTSPSHGRTQTMLIPPRSTRLSPWTT